MAQRLLTLTLFVSALTLTFASLTCLDRQGDQVPWFTFIKFPGNLTSSNARYAYFDPNLGSSTYQIVIGSHCDSKGEALPNTIDAINQISSKYLNLLVYNDEAPEKESDSTGAHAKGIIAFDNQTKTGVYIMHSLPKFPDVSESDGHIEYTIPNNTLIYGQNAYCISLDETSFNHVIAHLPVEWPNVYYSSGLFQGMPLKSTTQSMITQFTLIDGDSQWFLTKNPKYEGFLYENIISPYFQVSLAVESWGRPYQKSDCPPTTKYESLNIDRISFNSEDAWDHYSDHSKWTISVSVTNENVACLCDMNRMDSQEVRGGSCLCSKNPLLYGALNSIVATMDKCSTDEPYIIS